MDGFGTTTGDLLLLLGRDRPDHACRRRPRTTPSLGDSVFCADAATGTPVPIALKWNVDTRIPNVLAILPAARASRWRREDDVRLRGHDAR